MGYALSIGHDIDKAIKFANLAAAVVVEKSGTATTTMDEIRFKQYFANATDITSKIKSQSEIIQIISLLRKHNKKIVFTNGCFDILHAGHIYSLQQSKSYGDILVVGLNSDTSIKRIKGDSRPINVEEMRAITLAGMAAVDFIVSFEDDTPEDLIKLIQPDILTKGRDYEGAKISGQEWAKKIEFTDMVPGKSSTKLINRLIERNKK